MPRLSARARGYGGKWEKARAAFLAEHPTCSEPGCRLPAVHVHHTTPHKGDMRTFWDRSRWAGLCAHHHNATAQQRERRGYANDLGADGLPLDGQHPFNRG